MSAKPKHPAVDIIRCLVDGVLFASLRIPGMGTCEVRLAGECAELRAMFVVVEHRRKGVGDLLFDEAVNVALAGGKASLAWTVRKDNSAALLFYRAMGAEVFFDDAEDYWMGVLLCAGQRRLFKEAEPV